MSGMDMVMAQLQRFIPTQVWDGVTKGVSAVLAKVEQIDGRLTRMEENQARILTFLEARHGTVPETNTNPGHIDLGSPSTGGGGNGSTAGSDRAG